MLKKFFLFILLSLSVTSCSMLSPVKVEPVRKYVINTVPCVPRHHASRPISIVVPQPEANPIYNTTQIAFTLCPYQVDYYSKNFWIATPSQMLQPLIIQTLQDSHYFYAVGSSLAYGKYDYMLNTQLVELRHVFRTCDSYVRLKMRAQLINLSSNRVVAARAFCVTAPAPCCTPLGGVIAANNAAARMAAQITRFSVRGV